MLPGGSQRYATPESWDSFQSAGRRCVASFLLIYNDAYLSAAVCMSGLSGLVEKWSPLWCVIQNFIISHGADVSSLRK